MSEVIEVSKVTVYVMLSVITLLQAVLLYVAWLLLGARQELIRLKKKGMLEEDTRV